MWLPALLVVGGVDKDLVEDLVEALGERHTPPPEPRRHRVEHEEVLGHGLGRPNAGVRPQEDVLQLRLLLVRLLDRLLAPLRRRGRVLGRRLRLRGGLVGVGVLGVEQRVHAQVDIYGRHGCDRGDELALCFSGCGRLGEAISTAGMVEQLWTRGDRRRRRARAPG